MEKHTSFQRKIGGSESFISGTKLSYNTKQLLLSTGCTSLDSCIGNCRHFIYYEFA